MKKLLLLSAALLSISAAQAQVQKHTELFSDAFNRPVMVDNNVIGLKGAKNNDTIKGKINFPSSQLNDDSLIAYRADSAPFDSGYAFGTNAYGDKGFAERFDYNGKDSGLIVLGTYSIFDGRYTANTTKQVNFKVWTQGAVTNAGRTHLFMNGLPTTVLTTQSVSIKNLGINMTGKTDSLVYTKFGTATAILKDSFFVGYDITYAFNSLAGDTIGIKTTRDGYRYANYYFVTGADTTINVKNAAQYSDNSWHDNAFSNYQLGLHYCIFPVLVVKYNSTGVGGVTHNNLTFFGHSPNPAATSSTVHFSLKKNADVTITLNDMTGRTIRTVNYPNQSVGNHDAPLDLSALPAGDYMYVLRTSDGDGMASQLTVTK